jgi:RNA polymerase sigma factor (sigma-70 family)
LAYIADADRKNKFAKMSINNLFSLAREGGEAEREQLFDLLRESFCLVAQLRVWNRDDSEEIVQEAMATVAAKYRDLDFKGSFAAWARKVLENKIGDYYRKRKTRAAMFDRIPDAHAVPASSNTDPTLRMRLLDCLKKISAVSNRYARILSLRFQGYEVDEICARMNLNRNRVYLAVSRGRAMLRTCLDTGEID